MSEITLQLESAQPHHSEALSALQVEAVRNRFKIAQAVADEPIKLFVEQRLLDSFGEPFSHRVVACVDEHIVGTLCLTWKPKSGEEKARSTLFSKAMFHAWGAWKLLMLAYSVHLIKHEPVSQECYIADLFVLPEYQGHGIETRLIQWACDFAKKEANFNLLSVHLNDNDKEMTRFFEPFFFRTCLQKGSFARSLLLGSHRWNYMALAL